jgi:glucosylceramidase
LTAQNGEKFEEQENIHFGNSFTNAKAIKIFPKQKKQKIVGIGGSFTESTAFVLAHLNVKDRQVVMKKLFSKEGANYSLTRTTIASSDFCVEGKYSYAPIKDDMKLENFSIKVDHDGFKSSNYPNIKDESYDLLPMIQEAQAIKNNQEDKALRIIASAWTSPIWMKDNQSWFGGKLLSTHESTYADYIIKYLEAYKKEGVDIWGITPVNEPLGNNSNWESLHFTPKTQKEFIKNFLGPKLKAFGEVKLLANDHDRKELEAWADAVYGEEECAKYMYGLGIHWYESTFKVYEDILQKVHAKYPNYAIINTEACIDNLGNEAPQGILDPIGYKESDWFDNDAFWWHDNATDWAYTATWPGVISEDHPIYTPVHRYARNIIVSLNSWVSGWIDWNMVLDKRGGPNHVDNYCGAPIMIDLESAYVYYTPIYYILAQFSRTIRPEDDVVHSITDEELTQVGIYSCSSVNSDNVLSVQILNTNKEAVTFELQIETQVSLVNLPANCLQTIQIPLN